MAGSPGNGPPTGPARPRFYNLYDSYSGRDRSPDRRSSGRGRERSPDRRGSGRNYSPKRTRSPRSLSSYDEGKYGANDNYFSRGHGRRASRDEFSRSSSPRADRDSGRNFQKDSTVHQPLPALPSVNTSNTSSLDQGQTSKSAQPVSTASEKSTKLANIKQKSVELLGASLADIFEQLVSESVDAALLKSRQLTAGALRASAKADDKRFRKNGEQFPTSIESYSLKVETAARTYASISQKAKKKEELVKTASASAAANVIPMLLEATQHSSRLFSDKLKLDVDALEKRCQHFQTQYEEQKQMIYEMKSGNEKLDTTVKAQKAVIDKQTSSLESLKNRLSELEKQGDVATQMQSLSSKYSGLEQKHKETATSLHNIKQWQEKTTGDVSIALRSKVDTEKCLKDIELDIANIKKPSSAPPLPPDVLKSLDMVKSLSAGISRHDNLHDDLQKRVTLLEGKCTALSSNFMLVAKDQIDYRTRFTTINVRLDAVETRASQLEQSSQALQKENSAALERLTLSHASNFELLQQRINQKQSEVSLGVSKLQQRLASVESNAKSLAKSSEVAKLNQRLTIEMQQLSQQVDHEKQHYNTPAVKDFSETLQAVTALTKRLDILETGNSGPKWPDVSDIRARLQKLEASVPDTSSIADILTRLGKVEDTCDVAGEETDNRVGQLINDANEKLEKTAKALEDRIGSLEDGVSQIREVSSNNQTSHANISDAQERIGALERASQFAQSNGPPMQDTTSTSTGSLQSFEAHITQMISNFNVTFARLDDPRFSSLTQQCEANAAALDSLEVRYCGISTGDIYHAMASQFSANELPQLSQLQHSVSSLLLRVTRIESECSNQSTDEKIQGIEDQTSLLSGRIEVLEIQVPELAMAESFTMLKTQVDEMEKMLSHKGAELERRFQDDQAVSRTTRTDLHDLRTEVEVNKRSAANKLAEIMLDVNDKIESIQEKQPVRAPPPAPINGAKRKNMGSMSSGNSAHSPSPTLANGSPRKSPKPSPGASVPRKKIKASRKNYLDDDEPADFDEIPVRAPSDEDD